MMLNLVGLAGWVGTLWGRIALGAGLLVALVGVRACDVHKQQARGAEKVVEASKMKGAEANAINQKIRARAAEPGAAERLRNDKASCRDC